MVVAPGQNGIVAHVILSDGEFLPVNLNSEKTIVYRRGQSTNWELKIEKPLGMLAAVELLRPETKPICNFEGGNDPLHEHEDGTFWFYEETWAMENGPFPTYEEAYNALAEYCLGLERLKEIAEETAREILGEPVAEQEGSSDSSVGENRVPDSADVQEGK